MINLCKDKEKFLKKKFGIKPNQIVISYFDENCDQSNWSLSTTDEMEKKYIKICKFILKNKKFIILIKTQFLKNKPSVLFPNNEIIISAIKSKRFIEIDQKYFQKNYNLLDNGNTRNTVLPMMVAQISNITISEKYGGTTSLESIVLNKKKIYSLMIKILNGS